MKEKAPIVLVPTFIIAVVYFVDAVLFKVSGAGKGDIEDTSSAASSNWLEFASIILCVVVPAIYFNTKQNKQSSETQVPSASDASARLRAKVNKTPSHEHEGPAPKLKPLSEAFKAEDLAAAQRQTQSKQAAALARFNMSISNAAKAGQPSKAVQILSEITKAGLQPDTISYNSVIHAFAKQGDLRSAEKWLLKMREDSVEANTISYNILMDTCVKADNSASAEAWLAQMKKDGV